MLNKKIKDMSHEERRAYNREKVAKYRKKHGRELALKERESNRAYYHNKKNNTEFIKKLNYYVKKFRKENKHYFEKYRYEHKQELKLVKALGITMKEAKRLTGRIYFVPSYHFGISNYPEYQKCKSP